jgi:hypothetical protein
MTEPIVSDPVDYTGDPIRHETTDDYTGESTGVEYRDNGEGLRPRRPRPERIEQAEGMHGLLQAGHGFAVQTVTRDETKQIQTACKYCGDLLTNPVDHWLCEVTGAAADWAGCGCNWCECRRQYERAEHRKQARPRVQCGAPECYRKLRNENQRERRAREKALVAA